MQRPPLLLIQRLRKPQAIFLTSHCSNPTPAPAQCPSYIRNGSRVPRHLLHQVPPPISTTFQGCPRTCPPPDAFYTFSLADLWEHRAPWTGQQLAEGHVQRAQDRSAMMVGWPLCPHRPQSPQHAAFNTRQCHTLPQGTSFCFSLCVMGGVTEQRSGSG